MTKKLFVQAIGKFIFGLILLGLLLFVPAGTMKYPNGWLLIAILFIPVFFAGVFLMLKNPELLKKRLNAKKMKANRKWLWLTAVLCFLWHLSSQD